MTKIKNQENPLKYSGPTSLKKIETRLLEIEHEKPMRIYNLEQENTGSDEDMEEAENIDYLDVEKNKLQLKRQFILGRRDNWKAKSLWNVIVPIIVSIITAYMVFLVLNKVNSI